MNDPLLHLHVLDSCYLADAQSCLNGLTENRFWQFEMHALSLAGANEHVICQGISAAHGYDKESCRFVVLVCIVCLGRDSCYTELLPRHQKSVYLPRPTNRRFRCLNWPAPVFDACSKGANASWIGSSRYCLCDCKARHALGLLLHTCRVRI